TALPWWLYATGFAIGFAGFMLLNQQMKLRADLLIVWRGFVLSIALAPIMLLVDIPDQPTFFLAVIAVGFVACFTDMRVLKVSAEIGGGPLSRLLPIGVWISFSIWSVIDANFRDGLVADPLRSLGIMGCLALCVAAAAMLKNDAVSRSAIPQAMPIILGGALIDTLNKYAMSHAAPDQVLSAGLAYIWIQNLVIASLMVSRMAIDRNWQWRDDLFQRRMVLTGLTFAFLVGFVTLVRNFAMATTPNPGYVAAIGLGATVVIIVFNRWRGVPDKSNIKAGLAFVVSAAILVLLTP
ncbi:MAG: hypothetical protein AAF556_13355, partial [Pseudomonadota bacterium]